MSWQWGGGLGSGVWASPFEASAPGKVMTGFWAKEAWSPRTAEVSYFYWQETLRTTFQDCPFPLELTRCSHSGLRILFVPNDCPDWPMKTGWDCAYRCCFHSAGAQLHLCVISANNSNIPVATRVSYLTDVREAVWLSEHGVPGVIRPQFGIFCL